MPRARAKKLKPGLTENQVLAGVISAFKAFGVDAERQNTGGMTNPNGQYVAFSRKGNADLRGVFPSHFGVAAGKAWACEVKREGFSPLTKRGKKRRGEEIERFDLQVSKLRTLNAHGGYGWWSNDATAVPQILMRIREGWRIEIDAAGFPYMVSPEEQ